ncbi:MAG: single-stranded DNA-binding protein [Polyangiaceae bacterium]|jgi:single-strand DNA-binding protein
MAEGLNRVMLLGNLGADPELKVTQGGQAVLKLRLATTETYLDKGNQKQERTEWHRVTIWGRRGEALAKFLRKGDLLFVEGRLQTSSYERNGEKRYSTDIIAVNVVLPSSGRGRTEGQVARTDGPVRGAPAAPRDSGAPVFSEYGDEGAPVASVPGGVDPVGPDGAGDDDIPF